MLKLILQTFALLFVACQCSMPGGLNDGEITDHVLELADWTATQMPSIRGDTNSVYTVQNVVSVKTQVVSGKKENRL